MFTIPSKLKKYLVDSLENSEVNNNGIITESIKIKRDDEIKVSIINKVISKIKNLTNYRYSDSNNLQNIIIKKAIKILKDKLKTKIDNYDCFDEEDIVFLETILFIINQINYFTGLNVEITLDPHYNLECEFYGGENLIMCLAEKFNYPMQLKAINKSETFHFKGNEEDDTIDIKKCITENKSILSLIEINDTKFENINFDDVVYFPPYTHFCFKHKLSFRQYDKEDNFHACKNTSFTKNLDDEHLNLIKDEERVECNEKGLCSQFRRIDRVRLIEIAIKNVVNFKNLKKEKLFYKFVYMASQNQGLKLLKSQDIITKLFTPFETKNVLKTNNTVRNYFGENYALYFVFLAHLIKFLLFPTFVGLFYYILCKLLKFYEQFDHTIQYSPPKMIFNIIFTYIIILWSIIYIKSWSSLQKFYNYIWGMDHSISEGEINFKKEQAVVFMDVYIPEDNIFKIFFINIFVCVAAILLVIMTIFINLSIFYIANFKIYGNSAIDGKKEITSKFWYYTFPVLTVLIRTILSHLNYYVAELLVKILNETKQSTRENSYFKIVVCFEFVNYYFYLFYIAYVKTYLESCADNDCFVELGDNLIVTIITSNLINLLQISLPYIIDLFKRRSLVNQYKITLNLQMLLHYKYYTRVDYYRNVAWEYLDVTLQYGYVIMFGVSNPICFLFTLLYLIIKRILDLLKFVKVYNINTVDGYKNFSSVLKVLKLLTFFGIVTNISITFFTIQMMSQMKRRWLMVFWIENAMVIMFFLIRYKSSPNWFKFITQIKYNFLLKAMKIDNKLI